MTIERQHQQLPIIPNDTGSEVAAGRLIALVAGVAALATDPQQVVGVNRYAQEDGEAMTLDWGIVSVYVSGAVTIGDPLTVDPSNAGQAKAGAGGGAIGIAMETRTTAGLCKAFVFPAPLANADIVFTGELPSIADTASDTVAAGVATRAGSIRSVTVQMATALTKAEDGVDLALYRVRAGTATKIYAANVAASTGADLTAYEASSLTMETGASNAVLAAGDILYLTVTNETGGAYVPGIVVVTVAE